MSNPYYPEGVTEKDIDNIGEPLCPHEPLDEPENDEVTVAEVIEILEDVVNQSCSYTEGGKTYLDSAAISAYADAMRFLAAQGRIKITTEGGRRVIGEWVEVKK